MKNEPINFELTSQQLEIELVRIEKRRKRISHVTNTIAWLCLAIAVVGTVSALWFPVLFVSAPTTTGTEQRVAVLTMRTQLFQQEDWVIYDRGDGADLFRIVAVEDDSLALDHKGHLFVNEKEVGKVTIAEPVSVVPEGCVVLREPMGSEIFCVSDAAIAGKVLLQLWPLS